jgi:hypothetical protein
MSSVRRRVAVGALAAVVAAGAGIAVAGSQDDGDPGSNPRCPREAERLPPDALAGATHAALRDARRMFGRRRTRGMRAVSATLATSAERGPMVRHDCGRSIQRRTVVVDLLYVAELPSASLSQGSLAVSLFPDGEYRVWSILH